MSTCQDKAPIPPSLPPTPSSILWLHPSHLAPPLSPHPTGPAPPELPGQGQRPGVPVASAPSPAASTRGWAGHAHPGWAPAHRGRQRVFHLAVVQPGPGEYPPPLSLPPVRIRAGNSGPLGGPSRERKGGPPGPAQRREEGPWGLAKEGGETKDSSVPCGMEQGGGGRDC